MKVRNSRLLTKSMFIDYFNELFPAEFVIIKYYRNAYYLDLVWNLIIKML